MQNKKWYKLESSKRENIIMTSRGGNKICPLCGKKLNVTESANGYPLTKAKVCCDCDSRYVIPMRLAGLNEKLAPNMAKLFIEGELLIEQRRRIQAILNKETEVA